VPILLQKSSAVLQEDPWAELFDMQQLHIPTQDWLESNFWQLHRDVDDGDGNYDYDLTVRPYDAAPAPASAASAPSSPTSAPAADSGSRSFAAEKTSTAEAPAPSVCAHCCRECATTSPCGRRGAAPSTSYVHSWNSSEPQLV
jgi:hypothetical protein